MKRIYFCFVAVASLSFFASCSKEELPSFPSNGDYESGFFVLNEGNASNGTVSFVKSNFSSVIDNIFEIENPSESNVGRYPQSIFFNGDRAYVISGGSNIVTVVNRYTFKYITRIATGFLNPRYAVVFDGKAYVTNLADFSNLTDDYIAVVNLANNQIEGTIPVNGIADRLTEQNGKLYVLNGSFGEGSSLTVIDPTTNSIVTTIDTGLSPNSFEEYDGSLYVLCSNTTTSKILKINFDSNTIQSETSFATGMGNAQNLNIENGTSYCTIDNKIYSNPISTTTIPANSFLTLTTEPTSLYGFEVKGGALYVANPNGNTNGKVLVYSNTGSLLHQIEVGLFPNGFYFN